MSTSNALSSDITFVTAFMNIYPKDAPYGGKDFRWRFDRFVQLLETGIQLAVYVDETGVDLLEQCMEIFPNLKIMKVMSIYETWVHRLCEQYGGQDIALPAIRNTPKDTYEYLVLMNSKIEFIHDTMEYRIFCLDRFQCCSRIQGSRRVGGLSQDDFAMSIGTQVFGDSWLLAHHITWVQRFRHTTRHINHDTLAILRGVLLGRSGIRPEILSGLRTSLSRIFVQIQTIDLGSQCVGLVGIR